MARQSGRDDLQSRGGAQEQSGGDGERQETDAIEMLKADHRRVEQLFDKYEQARRRAEKSKLAQQICLELTIHAELEEEIFYPACREHVDDPLLDEAQVEHDTAKILTAEVAMGTPAADPFFDAKVMVLAEYMRRHIQEEEQGAESIFAKAMEGGVDTEELGQRMMARREELMDEFSEELMLPQPRTLHVTLEQDEEVWSTPPAAARQGARQATTRGRGRAQESSPWEGREEERAEWEGGENRGEARGYDERRASSGGGREEERRGEQAWQARGEGGRSRGRGEEGTGRGEEGRSARGAQEQKGWFGDPKRHSEASRRGWEHRR